MGPSFAVDLAAWHDFYSLVGASAATLMGLMFVAVTFTANLKAIEAAPSTRAFLDPTVAHFAQAIVTACAVLVPALEPSYFGGLLAAMGLFRGFALVGVSRTLLAAHRKNRDFELSDWLSGVVVPFGVYAGLAASGVAFLVGRTAFLALAVVTVVVLLNGVYSAWELLLWLAFQRAKAPEEKAE